MVWWLIATAASAFVKGLCGFANTLVFDTIMGFTADPALITPVEVVINTPSNCIMVARAAVYPVEKVPAGDGADHPGFHSGYADA